MNIVKAFCIVSLMVFGEASQAVLTNTSNANSFPRQPNIVLILADDLGWSDLGCYGHPFHRTPHLNRLAAQGITFSDGYAPAPICSASRASILTGKTTARLGFEFVTKNEPGFQKLDTEVPLRAPEFTLNLPTSERTIAEYLNDLGYHTAFFGKWHVNQHYQGKYLAWHPDYGPRAQGFQTAVEDFGDHPYAWKKRTPAALPAGQFPQDSLVERAALHLKKSLTSETSPAFVMVSSFYVHTPVRNRCRWLVEEYDSLVPQNSPNRNKRLEYAAFVQTLDHHVGTLLTAIEESGESENTLVIFLSDNGGHPEFTSNAPLRGSKWNLYEGGIRVPLLMRWPAVIAAGRKSSYPVIGYDLLPTIVKLAGGQSEGVDGIDVADLFRDHSPERHRPLLWHFPFYHPERTFSKAQPDIGVADFAVSQTRPQSAMRFGRYKVLSFAETSRIEVYDVAKDRAEQHDLAKTDPDLTNRLRMELESQLDAMGARRATRD